MSHTGGYANCAICPRRCCADRTRGRSGFCGEGAELRLSSACLHFGEEPPITAAGGSGTIFVTGCNLRCSFCQNYQISQKGNGTAVSASDFARICLRLERAGAENINIITGSHAALALAEGIEEAKSQGLSIPVCWNTASYECEETLELLAPLIDIWLADLKTLDPKLSADCFAAADYPEWAERAIRFMLSRQESCSFRDIPAKDGTQIEKMTRGIIIRHLFLPGRLEDTRQVLDWLKEYADGHACVSLMSQYTPVPFPAADLAFRQRGLSAFENRLVSPEEFNELQKMIRSRDFSHLFYQELESDTEWLPDFNRIQPFSYALAKPVWHWKHGFVSGADTED